MKTDRAETTTTARMEIAVYPIGTGDASITPEVAAIFDILDSCGLTYTVGIMGTTVEGTVDELFELAAKLHGSVFSERVRRAITVIKLDERRRRDGTPQ